jgi:GT2 family glycosyltransferase
MAGLPVTVVVVPRERFSHARRSLESIYANTAGPFALVYVDGGSPRALRRYLAAEQRRLGFRLVRTDCFLTPNEARNLGLRYVDTRYVVFIDNDVEVTSGWLDALVRCAEESQAWLVGPLCFVGPPASEIIHVAGGEVAIHEEGARRVLHQLQRYEGRRPAEVALPLAAERSGLAEFHCMLARTDLFARLGPLDEALLNTREHIDLCLRVTAAGGSIYFEPRARVAYVAPPPLAWSDVPFYLVRWSDQWTRATMRHFEKTWQVRLDTGRPGIMRARRTIAFRPIRDLIRRLGGTWAPAIEWRSLRALDAALGPLALAAATRKRRRRRIRAG